MDTGPMIEERKEYTTRPHHTSPGCRRAGSVCSTAELYCRGDSTALRLSPSSALAFAVPALLYAIQNNLNYFALQHIDAPTYQLWGCSKLVFAGLFLRILLSRQLSARKWVGLGILAAGMALTTLRPGRAATSHEASSTVRGIALVLCTSSLSGLSSVFNEWLIKFADPKAPLMFKNFLLYGFGALMCAAGWRPSAPLGDPLLFGILVVVQVTAMGP